MNSDDNNEKITKDGLWVSRRYTGILVVSMLVLICAAFLGGYFVGKRHTMEQFVTRLEQDSFADQVYASLCELYGDDSEQFKDEEGDENGCGESEHSGNSEKIESAAVRESSVPAQPDASIAVQEGQKNSPSHYYAQLLGYHNKKEAADFVARLARKNIELEIKTRKSVTGRGKTKEWYQIVTKNYANRAELQALVDRVGREEKIKGAQIITCG